MKTLLEKLDSIVKEVPQRICMQIKMEDHYEKLTYQQFDHLARAVANGLIAKEIKPNDRIAILLDNCLEWGPIYFGILMAGAIAVPIDPQASIEDIEHFIKHAEVNLIFVNDERFEELNDKLHSIKHWITFSTKPNAVTFETFIKANNIERLSAIDENHLASILYTSGTTGIPKGVMLSQKNFISNFNSIESMKALPGKHNFLSILPLHHGFPFMATLIFPLFTKNKITYLKTLRQEEIFKCIKEAKITALIAVPQLFHLLAAAIDKKLKALTFPKKQLVNLTFGFCNLIRHTTHFNLTKKLFRSIHGKFGRQFIAFGSGGAKLNIEAEELLNRVGFTLVQGYGLTETSPVVSFNPLKKTKIGSAGKIINDVKVIIDQPNDDGVGEVLIQGNNVMVGYYKNQKATDDVIKEGWFYSGDLGYVDKENYLFLTGRKKEVIVLSNGKNIYPDELEQVYEQSKYIKEICIMNHLEHGTEKLIALVLPAFDYFKSINELDIDFSIRWDIENFSRHLPAYKRIMGYHLIKEPFPRTRLGKLKRYDIQNNYQKLISSNKADTEADETNDPEQLALISSDEFQLVKGMIQLQKNSELPIHLDDHLELDLGFDSLSRTELFAIIEQQYPVKFNEENVTKIYTVKDLITEMQNQNKGKTTIAAEKKNLSQSELWQNLLVKEPSKELLDKIELIPTLRTKVLNVIIIATLKLLFKLFFKFKFHGIENLPEKGPYIICANHVSFLDAFFIATTLPKEIRYQNYSLGYSGYFSSDTIVKSWRVIPIDPNARLMEALQASYYLLKKNKIMTIFPEARRSIDGSLQSFKQGVGILAKELQLSIVPIAIKGAFEAWPRTQKYPKSYPVSIQIGAPVSYDELAKIGYEIGAKDDYEAIAKGLHATIEKMVGRIGLEPMTN